MSTAITSELPGGGTAESDLEYLGAHKVRVFTIPGSHPGVSVQQMLAYKGIPYRLTNLLPVVSWGSSGRSGSPA